MVGKYSARIWQDHPLFCSSVRTMSTVSNAYALQGENFFSSLLGEVLLFFRKKYFFYIARRASPFMGQELRPFLYSGRRISPLLGEELVSYEKSFYSPAKSAASLQKGPHLLLFFFGEELLLSREKSFFFHRIRYLSALEEELLFSWENIFWSPWRTASIYYIYSSGKRSSTLLGKELLLIWEESF